MWTGLSAPVPRGRKGKKRKENLNFLADQDKPLDFDPEIVLDNGYKRHLHRHSNKLVFENWVVLSPYEFLLLFSFLWWGLGASFVENFWLCYVSLVLYVSHKRMRNDDDHHHQHRKKVSYIIMYFAYDLFWLCFWKFYYVEVTKLLIFICIDFPGCCYEWDCSITLNRSWLVMKQRRCFKTYHTRM